MTTHYSYLTDPKNFTRVITVARVIEGDTIVFGISVCRPTEWTCDYEGSRYRGLRRVKGDQHKKAKGRMIAENRMNSLKHRLTVQRVEGEHPMLTIAKSMTSEHRGELPKFVERTFADYVYFVAWNEKTRKLFSDARAIVTVV